MTISRVILKSITNKKKKERIFIVASHSFLLCLWLSRGVCTVLGILLGHPVVTLLVAQAWRNMWRTFRFHALCFKHSGGFSRHIVTAQELRTFQEQGVVCLRGVFGEWIQKLTTGIAKTEANPSKFSERLTTAGSSQSFYFNDYFNWRQIPEFGEFVYKSPAGEIAGKLMEAEVYFCPDQGKR